MKPDRLRSVFIAILCSCAVACGSAAPDSLRMSEEDVVGKWTGDDGGLDVSADGRFCATDLRADWLDGSRNLRERLTGCGKWIIMPYRKNGSSQIDLRIDEDGSSATFAAGGSLKSPRLWVEIGDPDDDDVVVLKKISGPAGASTGVVVTTGGTEK
ncbi:hypothetical protein [Embleya sp. NPDC050493]|uniref:hypothetical protein n=1 Tax=Embleya sp. NPDC050493 TaxID=3363989 RepID=UPI0037A786C8